MREQFGWISVQLLRFKDRNMIFLYRNVKTDDSSLFHFYLRHKKS